MPFTTVTSSITSVDIEVLRRELLSNGFVTLDIRPYKASGPVPTQVDLDGIIFGAQLVLAQSIIDNHVDSKLEDLNLKGKDQALFGTTNSGDVIFYNNGNAWKIDANRHFLPLFALRNIASITTPLGTIYSTDGNFAGNVTITGNLTVLGTETILNTTTLDVEDNEITVNSNVTGTPSLNAGLRNKRGTSSDAVLTWDEGVDYWKIGTVADLQKVLRQEDYNTLNTAINNHLTDFANPHAVTSTQVGLGNVTNDAQLKRSANDFNVFSVKSLPTGSDRLLIEDVAGSGVKKFITIGTINHDTLLNVGTNNHTQIDAHIASTSNPHSTTASQVGLGNVTNDAQLKRASGDFVTFTIKATPVTGDILLIEDSAASNAKKYVTIGSLASAIGAGVSSFNGRTGAVVPLAGDYTASMIGLGNVTDDAQLKRAGNDYTTFTLKAAPVAGDVILLEDSVATFSKKKFTIGSINHDILTNVGTYNHSQIDAHINNLANPHSVTKTQLGLGNVTDDAQLKRAANDFNSFTAKASPTGSDILIIEDAAAAGVKKYITIGNINHQTLTGAGTNTHAQIDSHISSTSNPHNTTATQVGLGNVTNDAQLKRAANDFSSFSNKVLAVAADVFLIEDSGAAGAKKYVSLSQIDHQGLSGAGTNTHAQIDSHIASTSNPHSTTASQVGLGNVTNDAQLKRAAGDFVSFTSKTTPIGADYLLIEDSQAGNAKKKITLGDIPVSALGGGVDTSSDQNIGGIKTFTSKVQIKTHSGFTGSANQKLTAGLLTTTAVTQNLATVAVSANCIGRFKIDVSARRADGTDKYYWSFISGGVRRSASNSGNATLVGSAPAILEDSEGNPGYTARVDVSGTDLRVRVTGEAADVVWTATIEYQETLLST
jgi:hypothetical protein